MSGLVAIVVVLAAAAAVAYLRAPTVVRRDERAQAELARAAAAVDRELAADLELMAMFGQTKRAFVLENAQYLAAAAVIEREAPDAYSLVADLYHRIPDTESAMERRGPAGSIAEADRRTVEEWEGDAREAQRLLRASTAPRRAPRWRLVAERLGVRRMTR